MKRVNKIFHLFYLITFIYIYIFTVDNYLSRDIWSSVFAGACYLLAAMVIYSLVKSKQKKISRRSATITYLVFMVIILLVQIYMVAKLNLTPHSDSKYVDLAARNFGMDGNFDNMMRNLEDHPLYFYHFPNNWGVVMLLSYYYRIVFLVVGWIPSYASQVLNIVFIQISIFLIYLISSLIYKDKVRPIFCGALALTMPALYIYTPIVYTDTLSMPFVLGAVYFFLRAVKNKSFKKSLLQMFFAALLVGMGNTIKGSLIILLIAFILYLILRAGWKRTVSYSAILVALFLICSSVVNAMGLHQGFATKELLNRYQIPHEHWVMMSLKGNGGFYLEDLHYTEGFESIEEKKAANIIKIRKRIENYGFEGLWSHQKEKTLYTWSDGKFYCPNHYRHIDKSSLSYFILKGEKFDIYAHGVHLTMLTLMLASCYYGFKHTRRSPVALIRMSVTGLALFLMVWETRSRYLINFIPLMYIMSADGMNYLSAAMCKRAKGLAVVFSKKRKT